jgi:ABC-2 type transport system permease protein
MKQALSITRKELDSYFGSPMALIFIGIFLAGTLFSFFWASGFFARGIADVRPLFQWMPILLILLISTLTMRQWSEEQQTGTLEVLLTMPVKLTQLVVGKFLAVLGLVVVALLLTLSLPITVRLLGNLDLGPVIGGYLAAILLASAYIAIGLFVSSRTDNQIVSLLITALICGAFYLIGSSTVTSLTTTSTTELLQALGTGSRFESIERGVIDLRDLVYYGSLTIIFLTLNILALDSKRWSKGLKTRLYRFNTRLATALVIVNLIVFNLLMFRVGAVRADLTQSGEYTLSSVTTDLMGNLREPLFIRGYFSEDNHPLLAPLIPIVRDTLEEYKVAARGKLNLDFVDPITNPDVEQEAKQLYGINPTPLQVSNRGKTSVVNAYLSILIRYGDQSVVLDLLNMIDVQNVGGSPDVRLRNLEYDLTSSIQRVVYGFQSLDAVFASLEQPAKVTLYVTPKTLPEELKKAPDTIKAVADAITKQANGKFVFTALDVSNPQSGVDTQTLYSKYQIQPVTASIFSTDQFYLHMLVEIGSKWQVIYPSGDTSDAQIRSSIEAALKRLAPGFLHVIGLWMPPDLSQMTGQQNLQQYAQLQQTLSQNFETRIVDLSSGQVASDIDALVVVNPKYMSDKERYAIDQYLMRGGAVFVAAGNYEIMVTQEGGLGLQAVSNSLQEMLASYGITVEQKLVLDEQNGVIPLPVSGGVSIVNYPHFVDVRSNAMDQSSPIVARLSAITLDWTSPITLDAEKTKNAQVTTLMRSSDKAWTTTDTNTSPNFNLYQTGFAAPDARSAYTLAVAVQGSFSSYFNGKASPFTSTETSGTGTPTPTPAPGSVPTEFLAKSPDTARLIVVGGSEFLDDTISGLVSRIGVDAVTSSMQFVQNSVEWFVQDTALSNIRAKGQSNRVLAPISDAEKARWEAGNYIFALAALIALGLIWQLRKRSEKPIELVTPAQSQEGAA